MSNPRREVEFTLGAVTIRSRPTLAKVAEIETKFGPLASLLDKIGTSQMSLSGQTLPILSIVLRGCDDAPKGDTALREAIFEQGVAEMNGPLIRWIVAAYTANEPAEETPEGN